MSVTFRTLRTEDKELFKSFIRSLPRMDNYYLMVDVHDDQAINRWMKAAYPVDSGSSICSGAGGSAPLRGLSRFMMSQ